MFEWLFIIAKISFYIITTILGLFGIFLGICMIVGMKENRITVETMEHRFKDLKNLYNIKEGD